MATLMGMSTATDRRQPAPVQDHDFAAEAGTHSALALARVGQGQVDGAAEALQSVLDLPRLSAFTRSQPHWN